MRIVQIEAQARSERGKGAARQLRLSGLIPAVVYGEDVANLSIALSVLDAQRLVKLGPSGLVELRVKDESTQTTKSVLIKEVQRDPIRGDVLHMDFHEVPMDRELETSVPIVTVGTEPEEGVLQQTLRELEVACLPTAIPQRLEVDISELEVGDALYVRNIAVPEGVRPITPEDELVLSVVTPTFEEEPEEEEEEAVDELEEPELVGEEDEEGAEEEPEEEE